MSGQACRPVGVEPGGELIDPAANVFGVVPPLAAAAPSMVTGPHFRTPRSVPDPRRAELSGPCGADADPPPARGTDRRPSAVRGRRGSRPRVTEPGSLPRRAARHPDAEPVGDQRGDASEGVCLARPPEPTGGSGPVKGVMILCRPGKASWRRRAMAHAPPLTVPACSGARGQRATQPAIPREQP